jgi:hypothetical protein
LSKLPSTTFAKADRGFIQGIEQERHAKLAKNSAPKNRSRTPSKAYFTKNFFEFQMPINNKVVCLDILCIFPLGGFELFRKILENMHKVYTDTRGSKGH